MFQLHVREMPFGLARYWDSLESDEYYEPCSTVKLKELDATTQQWLDELSFSTEHECHIVLYGKSLLSEVDRCSSSSLPQHVAALARPKVLSSSTGDLVPPPKPQRRIARLKNNKNETISQSQPSPATSVSTLDLIEACKFTGQFNEAAVDVPYCNGLINHPQPHKADIINNNYWQPPGLRPRRESAATVISITGSQTSLVASKPPPPSYDQLDLRSSKVLRRAGLRHTIAVNQEDVEKARQKRPEEKSLPPIPQSSSPKSMHSDSTCSVDSGQCSADIAMTSMHSFSSSREEPQRESSPFQPSFSRTLPGYPRMASTMDHVLRTSSAIYSLLGSSASQTTFRDLIAKAAVFVQIVENSPCVHNVPRQDLDSVRHHLGELRAVQSSLGGTDSFTVTNYFTVIVRKLVEQVLQIFARIICKYLSECGSRDRLVVIALEHLIHVALFGDELSLEIIQCGGITSLVKLLKCSATGIDSTRLIMRALAVLCGVAKGCLTLLSLGGLEVVLQQLNSVSITCSIEAAGVLTQLTNPQHAFVKLNQAENILVRLIELIDECATGEALLLVAAAVANVSLHEPKSVDTLYQRNTIAKLIQAYHRQDCATIFVQEQIATIFSRLAARRYEEALVAQGAVPVLLEMLTVTDTVHGEYCRRIRYKAAVCIGTLASTGIGLKALYNNQGYAILCHVLEMENSAANPLNMICTNIRTRLESKYQLESAV